jgi:Chitobiase/beta-hexosaminidase C-terminal domain
LAEFKNVKFGIAQINKIYLGEKLVWNYEEPDITAPTTTIYPDPTLTYGSGHKIWFEVTEACNTYYTLDGTEPTTNSTLFTEEITLNATTTIKYFSVDLAGNVESVNTTTINIVTVPATTINPTNTTQNTIPITVTLSATNNPTAIYYKLGATGTQKTYTVPFEVTQSSAGVNSTNIKVTYWSVNANGTEAENVITYNTSGAMPSKPVATVTNLENAVKLDWSATTNTTSYTVFRSDIQGQRGTVLLPSQYQTVTTYTDSTAIGGNTYYYTVQAGTYSQINDSVQVTGQPTSAPSKPTFRYIRIDGYGEYYTGAGYTNTRMIDVEIFSGGINRMAGKTGTTDDTVDFGTDVGATSITRVTDGVKGIGSTTYNGWWGATTNNGNAHVVFDLGTAYAIDSIRYWAYTSRSPRFIIWGSNNLADFGANGALGGGATKIWDMQTNDGLIVTGATAGTNNYIEKIF